MSPTNREIPEKPILAVCGDTGLKEHSGVIREEFHPHLTGDKWLKVATEMAMNEGNLAASHMVIEMMVRNTPRTIRKNDSGHPLAAEAQEYVQQCWEDMESTPQEVLAHAVTAIQWGWSWLEIEYKVRQGGQEEPLLRSQYSDGRWGWRDFSPRSQDSRDVWELDDAGRVVGLWQRTERKPQRLFVPRDKSLHFRYRGTKGNPEGLSFYRPAYPSYYYAKRLREIESISLERDGAGLPDFQVPTQILSPNASSDEKAILAEIEAFVRKVRFDQLGGIVRPAEIDSAEKPTGYKFQLLSASGRNNAQFDIAIKRYQHEMLKAFLTQFLAFGISQEGSHALGDSMTSNLGYSIGAINKATDEEITRSAICQLMRLEGYPEDAWPWMESSDVETPRLAEAGAFLSSLISVGALQPDKQIEDWARKQLGLESAEGPSLDDMLGAVGEAPAIEPSESGADSGEVQEQMTEQMDVPEPEPAEMMSDEDAAEYLNIDRNRIRRAVRRGEIPGVKVGRNYRIRRSDVDRLFGGSL